jgi:hypothetical protein
MKGAKMKAISVRQPWASLIAEGKKTIETRTKQTSYRGDILIVSSKLQVASGLPLGQALCVAKLCESRPMTKEDEKAAMVRFFPGMFAWVLSGIRPIEPFPVQGKTGIYEVDFEYPAPST